jgi:hypothetical protein
MRVTIPRVKTFGTPRRGHSVPGPAVGDAACAQQPWQGATHRSLAVGITGDELGYHQSNDRRPVATSRDHSRQPDRLSPRTDPRIIHW